MHGPEEEDSARSPDPPWRAIVAALTAIILLGVGVIVTQQITVARDLRELSEREAAATARLQGALDVVRLECETLRRQVSVNTPRIEKLERDLVALEQRVEYVRTYQLRGGH